MMTIEEAERIFKDPETHTFPEVIEAAMMITAPIYEVKHDQAV